MFRKPFKVKSNTQIKGSERKLLKEQICKTFSELTDDDIESIMPKKEPVNLIKITTSNQNFVNIYSVQKRAIFFEYADNLYPTVYLLWKYTNLIKTFTTHEDIVNNYLYSGADLMLAGVIPESICGTFSGNMPAAVNTTQNIAPLAVGITAQNSTEMIKRRGKCVIIYHFYGDKLCTIEGLSCLPVPNLQPPDFIKEDQPNDKPDDTELAEEGGSEGVIETLEEATPVATTEATAEASGINTQEDMDHLFLHCFLAALKYSKTISLPLLTSNFFKLQMIPMCPSDKKLEIKKSSYKKFSNFISAMKENGFITVKEAKKGVETIESINKDHQSLKEFYVDKSKRSHLQTDTNSAGPSTSINEGFIVTERVLPIFAEYGLRKSDIIQKSDIRKYVTDYIKKNNYQDEINKGLVHSRDILKTICKREGLMRFEEVLEKVCDSMSSCYKVSSGHIQVTSKGKLSPITINVATRAGNKKVTLIDNLELYGISIGDFAKDCQHGAAASVSISKPPGKKCDQLLVQGNQVLLVYNLLTDKYKIPKTYIRGLENAPKKKK